MASNKPLITPLGQCIAEQDWEKQVDEDQVRRGELIRCMARLDRLVDELDQLCRLPSIGRTRFTKQLLREFQAELKDVKRSIYETIAPKKEH